MKESSNINEQNKDQDKIWVTSDDLPFFDRVSAENHAVQLEDKSIKCVTKEELENEAELLLNNANERVETEEEAELIWEE